MGWKQTLSALLGISAYEKTEGQSGIGVGLDDENVERMRARFGGQLVQLPTTQTRWYLRDLEQAMHQADGGTLSDAARLCRAIRRDGVLAGLLATRTSGLVRLPKRIRGDAEIVEALERRDGVTARSVFDEMFPSSELALIAADGISLGVGVGELRPVQNRDFPILIRIDPEFLVYRWTENKWYLNSVAGLIEITPGDGRWVLHVPGGRVAPWQHGLWPALGQSWIQKQHAMMHRANYGAKLANPARAAYAPAGATESQRHGFLANLIGWGVNTTFEMPPGWDVKLIESKGEGHQVFKDEIATCDNEIIVALAGQTVTTDGGSGFANADIHKSIRADLIKETADALAYTINTQGIPQFVVRRWGLDRLLAGGAVVEWDVTPPKDVKQEAESLKAFGEALISISAALKPFGRAIDIGSICSKYAVPIAQDGDGDGNPDADGSVDVDVDFDLIGEKPTEENNTLQ